MCDIHISLFIAQQPRLLWEVTPPSLLTAALQARDLGFQVAAKRVEELQAVVGRIAEDATSGNDSPVGIPPQRAKPAGVRPDPKARPFTPGMGLII